MHQGYQWLFHPQFCGRLHCRWYLYVLHWRHHLENKGVYCLLLIVSCFIKMEKYCFVFLQEITVSGPDGTQEKIEVPIWNGTAANIILMSLGPRCLFLVAFVFCVLYCVFFRVCNSTAANIKIISLIPNWLVCFPCDRIDMLVHIIISKYLSQFVLWFPVFLLTFQNVILIIFVWHSMLSQLGKLPWKLYGREWGHSLTRLCD